MAILSIDYIIALPYKKLNYTKTIIMQLTNDEQVLQSIVQKAWKDPAFKSNLISNPVATVETFLGRPMSLSADKNICFVDQTDNSTVFINIPAEPNMDDMELDDDQLDIVSGGDGNPIFVKPINSDGNIFGN